MSISLVLADDHPVVLEGLQALFSLPDYEVLATAQDGPSCLEAVLSFDPDILVVDHQMPKMTGLEVLAVLRDKAVRTRPVVLTGTLEESRVMEAIQLGARGVIPKDLAARHLLQCVAAVAAGGTWIEPELLRRAIEMKPRETVMALLTPREREIVQRVVGGSRNKEIARQMRISEGTVKMHLHNVYAKLNVGSRTELAVLANKLGL
jgi:two-component system, NarL family, nitrate/nitrite response regulator NarL